MRKIKAEETSKLLQYLFKVLSDTKRTKIKDYLERRAISVNGEVTTRFDYPIHPGDQIEIQTDTSVLKQIEPEFGIKVVYEDDALIVIHKPSGLLTIATDKIVGRNAFTATNEYLNFVAAQKKSRKAQNTEKFSSRLKQIFLVHRLDRDTSGLLMFAKNESMKMALQGNWEQVEKRYFAVVEGVPKKDSGTIESFLTENKILRVYSGPKEKESKWAITHYRVLKSSDQYSLLDIQIETGRKHQIRVHLSDLGHPVAGDKDYGAKTNPVGRLCLHSYLLKFPHPISEKPMTVESKIPSEFNKILA